MFGSVFRLNDIRCHSDIPQLTIISMSLCDSDDEKLKELVTAMQKEYLKDGARSNSEGEEPTLISLSIVLLNMGYLNHAKTFLFRMLKTLNHESDTIDIGKCYLYIGDVHRQKGDFRKSKSSYRKALKTFACVFPNDDHPIVAATYVSLGHCYSKITDWKLAAWYRTDFTNWWTTNISTRWRKSLDPYTKALTIYRQSYGEEHPRVAACYSSIGLMHFYDRNYELAIDNYRRALDILEKCLPSLHQDLAFCHNKLALIFNHILQEETAIEHCKLSLDIGLKSLPVGHPLIIHLYYVLGNIYRNRGNIPESDEYFRKQIELLDTPGTTASSMVEVIEVFGGKIHYLCPRCRSPVWVYPLCWCYRGNTCPRCLRDIINCTGATRVSPQVNDSGGRIP
ncbi:unnamed protein product [Rotaria magnacalcarata]|uniref:Uncharacterized protein n=2 Tax=Rotaria magnacalcarata TaxID=392030 RepID=A0A820DGJ2_9BILA|nr:unnamed protein product [Rotaria magnacalcarata]CAF4231902.1 unnamed protein product [Rotaria magnacalcarata]